jgi:hypothetical protein
METAMDTSRIQLSGVRRFAWLGCVTFLAACGIFGGGGSKNTASTPMQSSSNAPAATGSVEAKREAGNYDLKVAVQHMAPPEKIKEGATTYVVWAEPTAGGSAQNLGQLKLDKDQRSGKLETVAPARPMKVLITAESGADATRPSGEPLLWTEVHD